MMLSVEECMEILNIDEISFEKHFILHCNINTMEIPVLGIFLPLNEAQKRLLICLIKKINAKRDVINIVWYENHQRISDNNYHQLAFQLRALFQRHELPANLLVTVPYYGLKLNESLWRSLGDTEKSVKEEENEIRETEEPQRGSNVKNPFAFMLSFFMLSLAIYWFR